jgi:hypothetical protein
MGTREMLERGVCPRCGQKMTYLERRQIGGNVYLYGVHVKKEMKKRTVKKCYLGPESQYINVSHMHRDENLVLRGLMSYDRAIEYLRRIVEYLRTEKLRDEERNLLSQVTRELMSISGIQESIGDSIRITKDELQDVLMYYDKRDTRRMSKEGKDRAREIFRKVFSSGRKILDVEG